MTEAEWLACEDLVPMLEFFRGKASDRKLRLFACTISRTSKVGSEIEWWVQVGERFADGLVETDELAFARQRKAPMFSPDIFASWVLSSNLTDITSELLKLGKWNQVDLLRDIFGNPFRPVTFSPSWRTDTAVTLAQQMYDSRDFSAMPILADALQDAGCDNDDMLNHCRFGDVHVRGCWVVDLLLGKG